MLQAGGTSVTTVTYGTPVTLMATVMSASGSTAPTAGSVDFQDNGSDLGLVTIDNVTGNSAVFTLVTTATQLQVTGGIHSITTLYTPATPNFYPDGNGNLASGLNVTPAALTIKATSNSKTYDSTVSASATPTVLGLLGSDSVSGLAEVYANRNAGSSKTLSVSAFTVNDANGGANYVVTTVTNTTGVIAKAALTVTALKNTKTYDSTTTAAAALPCPDFWDWIR